MTPPTLSLVQALERLHILDPAQLREVVQLQGAHSTAAALAGELVQRSWLTRFQADKLLLDHGSELQLGPYLILDRLGQGAAGDVYRARLQSTGKVVALKVLRSESTADPDTVARFHREMEIASKLCHPCIVRASDAGQVDSSLVLEMEYLQGIDLEALVRQSGPLPLLAACDYIRQATLALQHAHKVGLVHRDIKPANLFVCKYKVQDPLIGTTPYGLIKVFDLGLARLREPPPGSPTRNLTQLAGMSVMQGTPDYMAPEQALDFGSADIRSDIYSLGCSFYYLLTGKPPFSGTLAEKLIKHQQAPPPGLDGARAGIPPALSALVKKMMAKQPADRFQRPVEVAQALDEILSSLRQRVRHTAEPAAPDSSVEFMGQIPEGSGLSSLHLSRPPAGSGRGKVLALAAGLVAASGLLLWWFSSRGDQEKPTAPAVNPAPFTSTLSDWKPPTSVAPKK